MRIDCPTPAEIPALRQLWKAAFGDTDAYLDIFFSAAFSESRCRCVFADNKLLSMLYWFPCACREKEYAYLYAIATDEASRGKGCCSALMEDTHRLLQKEGYAGCVLVPADDKLRQFYRKFGYRDFGGISEKTALPAETPVVFSPISAETYAARRKEFLPEGFIQQAGINLAFLQKLGKFYGGADFIFFLQEDFAPELLGNADPAAIAKALRLEKLTYRTPGEDPFAMCLSFGDESLPAYFGFAFD